MQVCKLAFDAYKPLTPKFQQPLIILHGLFGSRQNSRTLASKLQERGSTVYVLDSRNHGDSAQNPVHTYKSMAYDVANFIESQKIVRPHVIGHSMGAKTAMALALLEPSLVDHVIAVDNAPLKHVLPQDFATYLKGMKKVAELKSNRQRDLFEALKPFCSDLTVAYFLLSNFKRGPDNIFQPRIPLDILENNLGNIADFEFNNSSNNPLMLVRGAKSPFVPQSAIDYTYKVFPNTEVHTLDCGHWVLQEKQPEFIDLLYQFVV